MPLSFGRRFETMPASRLVDIFGTNHNPVCMMGLPLRTISWIPAHDAYRKRLRDILCHGEKLRHRFEGLPAVILIQSGNYDPFSPIGKFLAHIDQICLEKLSFIDSDDLRIFAEFQDLHRIIHHKGSERLLAVRDNMLCAVPVINAGLEDRDLLFRYLRSPRPPDQFFGLSAEHATAYNFDPACLPRYAVEF